MTDTNPTVDRPGNDRSHGTDTDATENRPAEQDASRTAFAPSPAGRQPVEALDATENQTLPAWVDPGARKVHAPPTTKTDPALAHIGASIDEAKQIAHKLYGTHGGPKQKPNPHLAAAARVGNPQIPSLTTDHLGNDEVALRRCGVAQRRATARHPST